MILKLSGKGSDARAFMRSTLAPLMNPSMKVYEDLRRDVFSKYAGLKAVDAA
jgi:hypothetical protein